MHILGYKEAATFANKTTYVTVLKTDKTTFVENFLKNPSFANKTLTTNQVKFRESGPSSYVQEKVCDFNFSSKDEQQKQGNSISDRYHGPHS